MLSVQDAPLASEQAQVVFSSFIEGLAQLSRQQVSELIQCIQMCVMAVVTKPEQTQHVRRRSRPLVSHKPN